MKYLSKHFVSESGNQLVLEPEDWTPEQFEAFMKIFGVTEAERIVISEYRIETYAEAKVGEAGWVGQFALQTTLLPLKQRYDSGERSRSLYDEIMACA